MIGWRLTALAVESAAIPAAFVPASLMSLRASLSEKEDISLGGLPDTFSKPRKGTLLQYTTSSDSSGLSLELTCEGRQNGVSYLKSAADSAPAPTPPLTLAGSFFGAFLTPFATSSSELEEKLAQLPLFPS